MAVSAGGANSLALKADGSLWVWGLQGFTIKQGATALQIDSVYVPTRVGTGTDWVAVAAGFAPCLGLQSDGSLWVWTASLTLGGLVPDASEPEQLTTGVKPPGFAGVSTATTTPTTTVAQTFSHVLAGHPYYTAIYSLAGLGVVSGYPDGTFGPNTPVLRKHFAKMIVGAMELPVSEADWQDMRTHRSPTVARTTSPAPIPMTATTFAADASITRAQMVTMVVRAAHNSGIDLDPVGADYAGTFQECSDPTHGSNVHLAEANGLLEGLVVTGDASAWMAGSATRGEVAQVLWNLMELRTD